MGYTKKSDEVAVIKPANLVQVKVKIKGTAPLVVNKFSFKARQQMMLAMSTPANQKKSKAARSPRDYDADFAGARHISSTGWDGIAASAFKNAMVDACRTTGAVMTKAKMSLWIIADGVDKDEGTPLVKIVSKKAPERHEGLVRNDNGGADVRIRPMWREWGAVVTVEFDADMITPESIVNLLDRAGRQVGICEGRPFSKNSCGMGWGTFQVQQS
jgi:hypothetical protein